MTFTAAQIAATLRITPQAVRKQLRGAEAASVVICAGVETRAWALDQLPANWRAQLVSASERAGCRTVEDFLKDPPKRWQPPLPLEKICEADIREAHLNLAIFKFWLERQHDPSLTSAQIDAGIVENYCRIKKIRKFSASSARKLFNRYVERDGGQDKWDELAIYLPVNPRPKEFKPDPSPADLSGKFDGLKNHLDNNLSDPACPTREDCTAVWTLVLKEYGKLLSGGTSAKSAGRQMLAFLSARAAFLAASRGALRKMLERRIANGVDDHRKRNGRRAEYPANDMDLIRHFASEDHDGCIDEAWRAHHRELSDYTRQRHPFGWACPKRFRKAINPEFVKALTLSKRSQKELREAVGFVRRDYTGMCAMDEFIFDDVTADVQEGFDSPDGESSLWRPQIILGIDAASRKVVSWSKSDDKGPTAKLVCIAVKQAISEHGVPDQITLENGWVFGRSLNINGKEDENGQAIVRGLANFGCEVYHHLPGNPTSKGDLENVINALQRRMKNLPGYTGNCERFHAADDFKKQERQISKGDAAAADFRLTFEQFSEKFDGIVADYNNTPQPYGRLNGLTPNDAFIKFKKAVKHATIPPQLHWLLDEQYIVLVKTGGVQISHYGKPLQVKGGELPQYIGQELRACVDRFDDSTVTFFTMDYSHTFTVETMPNPNRHETRLAAGSGKLAKARQNIGQHIKYFNGEANRLRGLLGNTRQRTLAEINHEMIDVPETAADRPLIVDPQIVEAGEAMKLQRAQFGDARAEEGRNQHRAQTFAEKTGLTLSAAGVAKLTPDQLRKLSKYKNAASL